MDFGGEMAAFALMYSDVFSVFFLFLLPPFSTLPSVMYPHTEKVIVAKVICSNPELTRDGLNIHEAATASSSLRSAMISSAASLRAPNVNVYIKMRTGRIMSLPLRRGGGGRRRC